MYSLSVRAICAPYCSINLLELKLHSIHLFLQRCMPFSPDESVDDNCRNTPLPNGDCSYVGELSCFAHWGWPHHHQAMSI